MLLAQGVAEKMARSEDWGRGQPTAVAAAATRGQR